MIPDHIVQSLVQKGAFEELVALDARFELAEFDGHKCVRIKGFKSYWMSDAYYAKKSPPMRGILKEKQLDGSWKTTII